MASWHEQTQAQGLKASYAASISTLREALNRLASDGFVAAEEQRGFVTPVSKHDLSEVANLRILLECHALKESVENGDTDWEGTLLRLILTASHGTPYAKQDETKRNFETL